MQMHRRTKDRKHSAHTHFSWILQWIKYEGQVPTARLIPTSSSSSSCTDFFLSSSLLPFCSLETCKQKFRVSFIHWTWRRFEHSGTWMSSYTTLETRDGEGSPRRHYVVKNTSQSLCMFSSGAITFQCYWSWLFFVNMCISFLRMRVCVTAWQQTLKKDTMFHEQIVCYRIISHLRFLSFVQCLLINQYSPFVIRKIICNNFWRM